MDIIIYFRVRIFIFLVVFFSFTFQISAQKLYLVTESDVVFSFANVKGVNGSMKTPVRFAPFFNFSHQLHKDFTKKVGISLGLELKNIGLIIRDTLRSKHRAYSIGLTLAFKAGQLYKNFYFYAGGTYEYLFSYKEKVFIGNEKIKRKDFYIHDVNQFMPSLFAGICFPREVTIRFQYYLDDFFSSQYRFQMPVTGYQYPPFLSSRLFLVTVGIRRSIQDPYQTRKKNEVLQVRNSERKRFL